MAQKNDKNAEQQTFPPHLIVMIEGTVRCSTSLHRNYVMLSLGQSKQQHFKRISQRLCSSIKSSLCRSTWFTSASSVLFCQAFCGCILLAVVLALSRSFFLLFDGVHPFQGFHVICAAVLIHFKFHISVLALSLVLAALDMHVNRWNWERTISNTTQRIYHMKIASAQDGDGAFCAQYPTEHESVLFRTVAYIHQFTYSMGHGTVHQANEQNAGVTRSHSME